MLKKLNFKITKLLFYIKTNLVSCAFKFSILSTMLILVYLVYMLTQTDSVATHNNNNEVYPMESSQKLMLSIPTETPIETSSYPDSSPSILTTEDLTYVIDNFIPKTSETSFGVHPFLTIPEQETTPTPRIDETTQLHHEESTKLTDPQTTYISAKEEITTTEPTIVSATFEEMILSNPFQETTTLEIKSEECTTSSPSKETTFLDDITITMPSSTAPFKRSLSIEELKNFETTTKASATEAISNFETTETSSTTEDIAMNFATLTSPSLEEANLMNFDTSTNPNSNDANLMNFETSTSPRIAEADFMNVETSTIPRREEPNLTNFEITTSSSTTEAISKKTSTPSDILLAQPEKENEMISSNLLTSSESEASKDESEVISHQTSTTPSSVSKDDLFMDNWENQLSAEHDTIQETNLDETDVHINPVNDTKDSFFQNEDFGMIPLEEIQILEKESNDKQSITTEKADVSTEINYSSEFKAPTTYPFPLFSPQSLLNLFKLDNQPSSSQLKATWWPNSKDLPISMTRSSSKNQRKRTNRMTSAGESENRPIFNRMNQFRSFDTTLNSKLKDSVGLWGKLFGNLMQ